MDVSTTRILLLGKVRVLALILLMVTHVAFAQKKKQTIQKSLPPFLEGVWMKHEVDEFGHETVTELSFTKAYNWMYLVKIDGNLFTKDFGAFKVLNDSLLTLMHGEKKIGNLPLVSLSADSFRVSLDTRTVTSLSRKK